MSGVELSNIESEHGRLVRVSIDRVEKLNVVNRALLSELKNVLVELSGDSDLRVVILQGAGDKAFVGGADISEMACLTPTTAKEFITELHETIDAVRRVPVPVIARIDGYCLGGGMELAAACDMRVATDRSKFGMPEVHVGIPSVIEAALLSRLMGRGRAARLVYTGEIIDSAKAYEWGFLEEVVDPSEIDSAVDRLADTILSAGANAIRAQKKLLNAWDNMTLSEAIEISIPIFAGSFETTEPTDRMQKFLGSKAKEG
jgi:enoyl-CoA hydratase